MNTLRTAVGLLGAVALGLAVGTVLAPDLAARLDVGALVGNDYLVVAPLGLGAVLLGLGVLGSRSLRGVEQATPPDPEGVPTADAPGAAFDRLVGGGLRTALAAHRRREDLRDRLRAAAIRTTMRAERCSHTAARNRIEAGTWTDDAAAAAFLADDPAQNKHTIRAIAAALLHLESPLQLRARHTARAIERLGRGDPT